MVGKLPSHMPYLFAHVRKSVGALSRADRPDAARKSITPRAFSLGGWVCLFPPIPPLGGRGPWSGQSEKNILQKIRSRDYVLEFHPSDQDQIWHVTTTSECE